MIPRLLRASLAVSSMFVAAASVLGQSAATVTVPVTYSTKFTSTDSQTLSADFSMQLTDDSLLWFYGLEVASTPRVVQLEVGKRYELVLTGYGTIQEWEYPWGTYYDAIPFDFTVSATTIGDYEVYVQNIARGMLGGGYGYAAVSVVVGPKDGCSDCGAGRIFKLKTNESRVDWSIDLGRGANGEVIKPLQFATSSLTLSAISRAKLKFSAMGSDVTRVPAQGTLQQIRTPGALLHAVDITDGYELRFYTLNQVGSQVSGVWQLLPGATPYVTYRFRSENGSNPTPSTVSFTRIIGSVQETHLLERDSGVWSVVRPGTGGTREVEPHPTLPNTEIVSWLDASSNLIRKVTRTYSDTITNQRELIKEVDGLGRVREWSYLTDTQYPGSAGKLNITKNHQGWWENRAYYNETSWTSVGQINRIYRPYKDTPNGTDHSISTLETGSWSEYQWATDINGVGKLLAQRVDRVGSTIVGKETATHSYSTANGRDLLTSTYLKHVDSNPSNALTTIRQEYAEVEWVDFLYHGKPYAIVAPDRTQISWVQQRGSWSGSAFTANTTGIAWREVEIRGSADSQGGASLLSSYLSQTIRPIYVMAGNSTLTVRIRDGGNLVREELYICSSGTTFELAGRVDREYSATGVVKKETRVDPANPSNPQLVVLYESDWTSGRKDWERDASGVKRNYLYDAMGRVWKVTAEGVSGMTNGLQHSQTTTYTRDAAGQVTQIEFKGSPGGTLITKRSYDLGGYLTESEEPGGRKTTYEYTLLSSGHWKVETTRPGGATRIDEYYRDGRLQSVGGTGEVAQSFDHWINTPGGGESNSRSPFVQHWATDWAGRRTLTVNYSPDNDNSFSSVVTNSYDSKGQLSVVTATGSRPVRFGYNPLLGWTEQGVDLNNNGQLDFSGMDPIRTRDIQFVKDGSNHWWRVETNGAFATDNSDTHTAFAVVETRLSGYSGSQLSQVRTKDAAGAITGNKTVRTTVFDWGAKKLVTTVDYPHATNDETITLLNGKLEKVTTAQGLLFKVGYDQFGREVSREDPRKGISEVEFVSGSNDVWRVRNEVDKAASAWTKTHTYDSAGRVATETNRLGMVTRYAYSSRGELTRRWGSGTTPVQFEYNSSGQRTKMHTYRGGSGWNGNDWPSSPGTADTTEWVYAPNSGVLTQKKDATNNYVDYTYHSDGQLKQRTWARGVTTTYNYSDARQLTGKTYSDGTPSVSNMTYYRSGQLKDVTDGVTGTRTFTYDSTGFMLSESLPAGYFGSGRSVQWQRDDYGRRSQVGIAQGGGYLFTQIYGYEGDKGRLTSLTSWSGGNGNGTSRETSYEYHTGSNEWQWLKNTWASHNVERTLETNRDAVSAFVQKTGTYEAIKVTYTRDALGRLATSTRDNTDNISVEPTPLFRGYLSEGAMVATYSYAETVDSVTVDRDQLTSESVVSIVEGLPSNSDKQSANRSSTFTYDNAQNRETATMLGATDNPTPNLLNQPDTWLTNTVTHDADGNMTSDGTWAYTYDGENRMKSCSKAGVTITYAYDFMGRRVEMKASYGTEWFFSKRFIWDGWSLLADIWGDYSATQNFTSVSFIFSSSYVWGIDVSGSVGGAGGVGGLALMYYNGRAFIPLQDGRGNIYGYYDTTEGKNATVWDLTPYGQAIHVRGWLPNYYGSQDFLFRFQSKMQDVDGHLLYYGHRFYHPGMGRFVNRDPIGEAGGLNLYGFVRNNPGNAWDYLGLSEEEETDPNTVFLDTMYVLPGFDQVLVLDPFVVEGTPDPFLQVVSDPFDIENFLDQIQEGTFADLFRDGEIGLEEKPGDTGTDLLESMRKTCQDLLSQIQSVHNSLISSLSAYHPSNPMSRAELDQALLDGLQGKAHGLASALSGLTHSGIVSAAGSYIAGSIQAGRDFERDEFNVWDGFLIGATAAGLVDEVYYGVNGQQLLTATGRAVVRRSAYVAMGLVVYDVGAEPTWEYVQRNATHGLHPTRQWEGTYGYGNSLKDMTAAYMAMGCDKILNGN